MAAPQIKPKDARVYDYLNDKIQTSADLRSLDSLLDALRNQHSLLRQQLDRVGKDLNEAEGEQKQHASSVIIKSEQYLQRQADIDNRLERVRTSQTVSEVVLNYRRNLDRLRQLEIAKGYITVLQAVNILKKQTQDVIASDPRAALIPYHQLQEISAQLRQKHEAAEGAAVHLVEYVEQAATQLWDDMKDRLTKQFQTTLDAIGWPTQELPEDKMQQFETEFTKVLALRKTDQERIRDVDISKFTSLSQISKAPKYGPLLAFTALSKAFALRFRYHFEGDRPTNKLEKPEWYFTHIISLIGEYSAFCTEFLQDILDGDGLGGRDALHEFITSLLPILRRKIDNDLPALAAQGPLASHFIQEVMKFDASLREEYMYSPFGIDLDDWKGLTHEVLVVNDGEFFKKWLVVEKNFALARYENIIAAEDAWVIDYDTVEPHETKPTKSALRVKDLLELVTERYRPLESFSQKLRFLIDIQITILDKYHDKIRGSIDAFKMLSSSIGRAVQGMGKQDADSVTGITGLERLCRVYGSALFLGNCMKDWGEDLFFLEMWEELGSRARKNTAGNLISSIVSLGSAAQENSEEEGALFDEIAASYSAILKEAANMIHDLVSNATREDLKAYYKIPQWQIIDGAEAKDPGISTELLPLLKTLPAFCSYLSRFWGPNVFQKEFRRVLVSLENYLIDNIVSRNQFSEQGGQQFFRDVQGIWSHLQTWLPGAPGVMRRLHETCILLALPAEIPDSETSGNQKTLKYIVDLMFEDNQKARVAMEELGLYKLYGPEDAETADGAEKDRSANEPEDKPDDDIESSIAAEIQGIKAQKQKKGKRITSIKLDTPCYQTAKANLVDLEDMTKEVLKPHFHEGQKGIKFAVRPNLRDHNVMNRDEIIKTVARIVGPDHKVDLKNYDRLIIVEVFRNICGVSVVQDFEQYKRFNLSKVVDESEGRTNENAGGVAPE
ncbi:hypothetical protein ABW19_dt0206149 [Dactylella cylindrospora]|nr:hypothetical protein ABW19_dt0206149 [Dactylella cylindrospora]